MSWSDVGDFFQDVGSSIADATAPVTNTVKKGRERERYLRKKYPAAYQLGLAGAGVGYAIAPKLQQALGMAQPSAVAALGLTGGAIGNQMDRQRIRAAEDADTAARNAQAEFDRIMASRKSIADASVAQRRRLSRRGAGFGQQAAGQSLGSDSILGA